MPILKFVSVPNLICVFIWNENLQADMCLCIYVHCTMYSVHANSMVLNWILENWKCVNIAVRFNQSRCNYIQLVVLHNSNNHNSRQHLIALVVRNISTLFIWLISFVSVIKWNLSTQSLCRILWARRWSVRFNNFIGISLSRILCVPRSLRSLIHFWSNSLTIRISIKQFGCLHTITKYERNFWCNNKIPFD